MPGQRPNRGPELWIISEPFGDEQITRARYGDESEKESSSLSCGFFVCSPFTRHGIVPQPTTKCHNFWELMMGTGTPSPQRPRSRLHDCRQSGKIHSHANCEHLERTGGAIHDASLRTSDAPLLCERRRSCSLPAVFGGDGHRHCGGHIFLDRCMLAAETWEVSLRD